MDGGGGDLGLFLASCGGGAGPEPGNGGKKMGLLSDFLK